MSYFFQNDSCSRFKAINTLKSSKKRYNYLSVPWIVDLAFIRRNLRKTVSLFSRKRCYASHGSTMNCPE